MIIDLILDRKDGLPYNRNDFYQDVKDYGSSWPHLAQPILSAFDSGSERRIRESLCDYIRKCGYNPQICSYINKTNWL